MSPFIRRVVVCRVIAASPRCRPSNISKNLKYRIMILIEKEFEISFSHKFHFDWIPLRHQLIWIDFG